jgi:serine/threonine protein kinase
MSDPLQCCDSIFAEAIAIESPQERAEYLVAACRGHDDLHREVARLVENHFRAGNFLETSPACRSGESLETIERAGAFIGPYRLIEQIGEGGFGVVYLAEQDRPVRRRVALKIIKPGMDTRQVIARFEAERQALALMDHSNIAKVFDAGATETGRPYFVMELIQGVPITKYCDQCSLTARERLELFASVCHAVQHAHQKGVIHRDLKPTNVLIAIDDGRPVPKIIDFGVAKAINQRLTENSVMTGFAQMIGTPLYMSPEQAELSPLGVDTRTDIYSLGVLLYELLTGTTPLERERLQTAAFDEVRRIIREEEPPRPSDRLSTLSANLANTLTERQRTDPPRLRQSIRGELDWIAMKCLEKDRNRRYESAGALAADVQRYLRDEPVEACPPSTAYRLRKFARRNRPTLIAGAIVLATLVTATIVSTWLAMRAIDAEGLAAARLTAEQRAHQEAEESFQKARQAVDDMYTQVAEKWLASQPQMEPVQRDFLQKALGFYTEAAQRTSREAAIRFETAKAQRRMGEIQHRLGDPRAAEVAFRRGIDQLQRLAEEDSQQAAYQAELAGALHQFGVLLGDTGRYTEEEQTHRRALDISRHLSATNRGETAYRRVLGQGYWYLGQTVAAMHRREEAEQSFRAGLAIQSRLAEEFSKIADYRHDLAETRLRLGITLGYLRRFDEHRQQLDAAASIWEGLVDEVPRSAVYRNELANVHYWRAYHAVYRERSSLHEAEPVLQLAISLQEQLVADYPSVTDYRYDLCRSQKLLGELLTQGERFDDAESALRKAATIAEKLAAEAPTVHYYRARQAMVQNALAELQVKTDRPAEAEAAYQQAIDLFKSLHAEFPDVWHYAPYLSQTYDKLAELLKAAGRSDAAAAAEHEAQRFAPPDKDALPKEVQTLGTTTNQEPLDGDAERTHIDR